MLRISFFIEFGDRLRKRFVDYGIIKHGFVHVVESDDVFFLERLIVQPPCFPHLSAQSVAVHGMFEECFRCPNEHLYVFRRQIGDAQWPYDEAFSPFIEVCDSQLSAESFVFRKGVAQDIAQ